MARRSTVPAVGVAVAAALIGMLALAVPAAAAPADAATLVALDTDTPAPVDTGEPTPTDTATPPASPEPSPTPQQPPTNPAPSTAPTAPPATAAAPPRMLGVTVMPTNAVLGLDYWSGDGTGAFTITVHNTGDLPAHATLRYTVPAGVTDAATGACGHGTCVIDGLAPGTDRSLTVAINVDGNAWQHAPLVGKVDFAATAPGADPATGSVGWGIVFPPGPPAAGIALQVADVTLDTDVTEPGQLVIRLTNTGARPASAVIDLVVPAGVSVDTFPADCQAQRQVDATTSECDLGGVLPGVQRAIAIPLAVSDQAREESPLAGLVRAALTPAGQGTRSTQASYQIIAPLTQSGVGAGSTASPAPSPASPAPDGADAAAQLIIFGSLLALALVVIGLIVVRHGDLLPRRPRPPPSSATVGPWRPVATFVPPSPGGDLGPEGGTVPAAPVSPAVAVPAAEAVVRPGSPAGARSEADARPEAEARAEANAGPEAGDAEPEPLGVGQITLEWTELPDSTSPPGGPVG